MIYIQDFDDAGYLTLRPQGQKHNRTKTSALVFTNARSKASVGSADCARRGVRSIAPFSKL